VTAPAESPRLRVALGEYDIGWHDPSLSLSRAAALAERAAEAGAELVVLPEMCTTGFTMRPAEQAEPLSGPGDAGLAGVAARSGVHLLAGVATRTAEGGRERYHNSALLFGPDGSLRAEYRKQRLFAYAGEHEAYSAGGAGTVWEVAGVRIAPFICYDLRFPELFRAVAPEADAIVVLANWPEARRSHWDVLARARAIENQCYVVAVNRTGEGGGIRYDGGSAAYDAWGERVSCEPRDGAPVVVTIDPAEVTRVRSRYPFVEDRRPGVERGATRPPPHPEPR